MKVVIAMVVYNRVLNIKHWIECWEKCDQTDAELVIIHNVAEIDAKTSLLINISLLGKKVKYVQRKNVGYDIGAYQDIFMERLEGFPNNWDYILCVADDTIPMTRDFVKRFTKNLINNYVGVSCMQISNEVATHVRTTGWCIKKGTSFKIKFPADPVTTKAHCWDFEHRGIRTLYNQILSMGLSCVEVSPLANSPLYDMGFETRNKEVLKIRSTLNRINEHEKEFAN